MEALIWFVIDMFRFLTGGILELVSATIFMLMILSREVLLVKLVVLAVCGIVFYFGYWLMPEGYNV